jgi:hypothetical protein
LKHLNDQEEKSQKRTRAMKKQMVLLTLLWVLTGCATRPEKIAPSYVSDMTYRNWECDELAREQSILASKIASESDAQQKASAKDAAGVFFLGIPVASMSGEDRAYEIARLKGELKALERATMAKNCNLPPIPDWTPPPSPPEPERTGAGIR